MSPNPIKVYISPKKKQLWRRYIKEHAEKYRSLSEMCERCTDNEVFGLEPSTNRPVMTVDNTKVLEKIERLTRLFEAQEKDRKQLDFIAEEIKHAAPDLTAETGRVAELLELAGTLRVDAISRILKIEIKIALACLVKLRDEKKTTLNESMEWVWNGE